MEDLYKHLEEQVSSLRSTCQHIGMSKKEIDKKIDKICDGIKDVLRINVEQVAKERSREEHFVRKSKERLRQFVTNANPGVMARIELLEGIPLRKQKSILKGIGKEVNLSSESEEQETASAATLSSSSSSKSKEQKVEDLVERKVIGSGDNMRILYLTKWAGSNDLTYEPPANIPLEILTRGRLGKLPTTYDDLAPASSNAAEKDGPPFQCLYCNTTFTNKSNRNRHCKTLHAADAKKFKCRICKMAFGFNWTRLRHMKVHKVKAERQRIECGIDNCERSFTCERSRANHIKTQHGPEGKPDRQKCVVCNKSYSTLASLKAHLALKHKDFSATRLLNSGSPTLPPDHVESREDGVVVPAGSSRVTRSQSVRISNTTSKQPEPEQQSASEKYREQFWELTIRNDPLIKGDKRLTIWSPVTNSHPKPFNRTFSYHLSEYETVSPFQNGKFILQQMNLLSNANGSVVGLIDWLLLLDETDGSTNDTLDYYLTRKYASQNVVQILPLISVSFEDGSETPEPVTLPITPLPLKDIVLAPIRVDDHFLLLCFDCGMRHAHVLNSFADELNAEETYNERARELARDIVKGYMGSSVRITKFSEEKTPKQDMSNKYSSRSCSSFVSYYVDEIVRKAVSVGVKKCVFSDGPLFPNKTWTGALCMRKNMFLTLLEDVRHGDGANKLKFLTKFN